MAAANSDQENVLLQSDEGSPSAPLPAGRLPFKAALAVGLCVFAAGLAGAVMMGRPAARAPTNIWHHRWSAIGLVDEHDIKHLTKECVDLMEAEERASAGGVEEEEDGASSEWRLDCKEESEQACTVDFHSCPEGYDCANITYEWCYPAVCKEANILKVFESYYNQIHAEGRYSKISGLTVSCAAPGDEFKHMTKECVDLLKALEKEAEQENRTHETGTVDLVGWKYSGIEGTLDCKEDSEQACTFYYSMWGQHITQEKCFPAVCKEANIFKQLEANLAEETGPSWDLHGLAVSCSGGTTTTTTTTVAKSRAGQCGPEVGLLGASVLVASIFAQ